MRTYLKVFSIIFGGLFIIYSVFCVSSYINTPDKHTAPVDNVVSISEEEEETTQEVEAAEEVTEAGGNLLGVPYMPAEKNDNYALLETYTALIYRDPYTLFENFEAKYMKEFETRRAEWLEDIFDIYSTGTRDDMVNWFVSYEQEISSMFAPELPEGTILYSGMDFTLPQLTNQYYTYMPIRAITSPTSYQFKFKQHLTTDELGFKRYGEAYAVALGSYFGITIGGIYEFQFQNGEKIYAVLGDCKSDNDTDSTHRFGVPPNAEDLYTGNIVEFIMDDSGWSELSASERVSSINDVIKERFPTRVVSIKFLGVSEHATIR